MMTTMRRSLAGCVSFLCLFVGRIAERMKDSVSTKREQTPTLTADNRKLSPLLQHLFDSLTDIGVARTRKVFLLNKHNED